MLIDHERAWHDLTRFILSKPNHGQAGLLAEMARLTDVHRVAEEGLPALLRLYGVEVHPAAGRPNDEGDALPLAVAAELHRHLTSRERHAGTENEERAAA